MTIKQLVERKDTLKKALDEVTMNSATDEEQTMVNTATLEVIAREASTVLASLEDIYENTEVLKDVEID